MILKTSARGGSATGGKNSKLETSAGFTLIELLIYIAIFSIVVVTMAGLLVSITQVGDKTTSSSEVSSQLNFVMQNIQRLVKNSSNIDITADISTSTLVLRMEDPAKDPTVIFLSSSTVYLEEGSSPTTSLTSGNVTVNYLNFKKISQYPGHDIVYVDLAITNNAPATSSQLTRTLSSAIARVSAATFDSGLVPGTGSNYDVGTTGSPWRNGYFSGVVGIGTTAPAFPLHIKTIGTDATIEINNTGGTASDWAIQSISGPAMGSTGAAFGIYSFTNSAYRLAINGSGSVGIGTVSPGYTLTVNGTAWVTGGAWSGSDIRWKKDIVPLTDVLAKVNQLQAVTFNWRQDEFPGMKFPSSSQIGFIAQDVKPLFPELVTTDNNGYEGISYEKFVPVLAEAIKELKAQNDALTVKVDELEKKIDTLSK